MILTQLPVHELRTNLMSSAISANCGIDDEKAIEAVLEFLDADSCELYYPHFYLNRIFDFEVNIIDQPEHLIEYEIDFNYRNCISFQVPALVPYVNHPLFQDFLKHIERIHHCSSVGNLLEIIYLPESDYAKSEDLLENEFTSYPASFLIGIQDNGGVSPNDIAMFFTHLSLVNDYITELIQDDKTLSCLHKQAV